MPQAKQKFHPPLIGLALLLGLGVVGVALKQLHTPSAKANQSSAQSLPNRKNAVEAPDTSTLQARHFTYSRSWGTAYVAHSIAAPVSVAVAEDLQPIDSFVSPTQRAYIINGGFFDPQNGKTTSHLIAQGEVVGDPANNERLVENPALAPYLPQILNRSEFRSYRCTDQGSLRYDIVFHNAPVPENCTVESAIGAGPQLLPEDTSVAEAFVDYENGQLTRDAIGSMQPNARSAIGLNDAGEIYLIMIQQDGNSSGLTLAGLAEFAASLGVTKLLNLDGGSSASIRFPDGQTYSGQVDVEGDPIQRPVKSVILSN